MSEESDFDTLIDSYVQTNTGIDPLFISDSLATGLRGHILHAISEGKLKAAGTGNQEGNAVRAAIRSDQICWLDKTSKNPFELEFLQQVDDFIRILNSTCYTGINACEFHYAVYEKDSFYKRHLDQFRNDDSRRFSLITYLNNDWTEEDGGQLQVFTEMNTRKILPHSRTAVFFKSDELEHEVMVTHRQRLSVTGWLKRV